jgi:hypothetical protein
MVEAIERLVGVRGDESFRAILALCKRFYGHKERIMVRRYWFSVRGAGDFPFRMLSVCNCWPATNNDAHNIALACPTVAPEQTIILASDKKLESKEIKLWNETKWQLIRIGEVGLVKM